MQLKNFCKHRAGALCFRIRTAVVCRHVNIMLIKAVLHVLILLLCRHIGACMYSLFLGLLFWLALRGLSEELTCSFHSCATSDSTNSFRYTIVLLGKCFLIM